MPVLADDHNQDNSISTKQKPKMKSEKLKSEALETSPVQRKRKIEEPESEDEDDDSEESQMSEDSEQGELKKPTNSFGNAVKHEFDAVKLRKKLFSREAGTELKMFAKDLHDTSEDKVDHVDLYMQAGGSSTEILNSLSELRHVDPGSAIAGFRILTVIFLRTLRDFPEKQAESEEAALKLIQTSAPFLNSLLKPSPKPFRVLVGLKLLTAMVSLSPRVAKEVLRVIDLGKDEIRWLTSGQGNKSEMIKGFLQIRKSFIHFLMAFLVDKETNTIQLLLSKGNIIGSAMLGLTRDRASLVNLALTTIRTMVVENLNVSKKLKQKAFHTKVLEALVTLYEWQGPKDSFKRYAKKKKTLEMKLVAEDDLKLVQESVHTFFKVLLTSYKFGVSFPSHNADMPQNHNMQSFSVLRKLQRPWDCHLKSELSIEVLKTCPTLLRPLLAIYIESLTPRPTLTWLRTLEFVIKVLESVDMSAFTIQENTRPNPKVVANMICSLALPITVMKAVLFPGLSHSHAAVKEATARLLTCILSRLSCHLEKAKDLFSFDQKSLDSTRAQIQHQLSKIIPSVSLVWDAWNLITLYDNQAQPEEISDCEKKKHGIPIMESSKITNMDLAAPEAISGHALQPPTHSNQLSTYVLLLLAYQEWLPHWLEISWGRGAASKILSSIKSAVDMLDDDAEADSMKVKAVCLLTNFDHLTISPHETLFSWAVEILVHGSFQNAEARRTLSKILAQIGIMIENNDELNVWVQSTDDRKDCKSALSAALVLLAKNLLDYTDKQYEIISSGQQSVSKVHSALLDEILGDLNQESDTNSQGFTSPYQDVAFSPLIVVLLQLMKEKAFKQHFDALQHMIPRATIQLLIQQSTPCNLIKVIENNSGLFPDIFSSFIKNPYNLPRNLLEPKEGKFYDFLAGDKQKLPKDLDEDFFKLKQLSRMVLYSVALKIESGTFDEEASNSHWKAIEKLLKIIPLGNHLSCLELAVCHPVLLNAFSMQATNPADIATNFFLIKVISAMKDHPSLASIRLKALQGVKKCLSIKGDKLSKLSWSKAHMIGELLLNLNLDLEEVHDLMKRLLSLPPTVWTSDKVNSSELLTSMLSSLLQRVLILREIMAGQARQIAFEEKDFEQCLHIFFELLKVKNRDLEHLQNALLNYLSVYPHHMKSISTDYVMKLLKNDSVPCVKVALLCLQWIDVNLAELEKWAKQADLSRSLPAYGKLQVRGKVDLTEFEAILWPSVQDELKNIVSNPSASTVQLFADNEEALINLITSCFDKSTSLKKIAKSLQGSYASEAVVANVICNLFTKSGKHIADLVAWILRSIAQSLEKESSKELLPVFCGHLIQILESCSDEGILSATKEDEIANFIKLSLKNGIGSECPLLKSLAAILPRVTDKKSYSTVLSMLLSHSLTMQCLLGYEDAKKEGILLLLDSLTSADPNLMSPNLLPVLLGAYNASLSKCDQIVFKLLAKYENQGISFKELQPLLWGEAAITRYSLRSHLGKSLQNQPSPSQILHNLDSHRVSLTLSYFPIKRGMANESSLVDARLYDPAFLLPLFAQILQPEVLLQPWLFTRNALPLTLMAFASEDGGIRNLAALIISRLYFHYEAGRISFEKKFWLHFMDTLRFTLSNAPDVQLPPVIALFLARSALVVSNPEHDMYQVLNMYLLAKQSIDLTDLPNFLRMMHSSEPSHKTHRQWIFNVLKNGLRNEKDFELFFSSFASKILAAFYISPLSDSKAKEDILQIFISVVKIPGAAKRLILSSGLISWINGVITSLPPAPTNDNTECPLSANILILLQTAWTNAELLETRGSVLVALSLLVDKVPAQERHLRPIVELLNATFSSQKSDKDIFTEKMLEQLLFLCKRAGIRNYCSCKDLMQYGIAGKNEFSLSALEKGLYEYINKWIIS
ncbi:uncharacterized protein LOC135938771 isoform X2 [Cloeon dipterum]|uniref:uncharacterized protein LOC135938771 isoform X2 n=1 Tax=Cloeon dipterum TaxID=197152 RepID=UPI00322032E7